MNSTHFFPCSAGLPPQNSGPQDNSSPTAGTEWSEPRCITTASLAPEPGTNYRQTFDCQSCRYSHSASDHNIMYIIIYMYFACKVHVYITGECLLQISKLSSQNNKQRHYYCVIATMFLRQNLECSGRQNE